MSDLTDLKSKITALNEKRSYYKTAAKAAMDTLTKLEERKSDLEKARVIIQTVATSIQRNLEFRISNLATIALEGLFVDPYKVKLKFVAKRGGSEADIYFAKGDKIIDPMDSAEYGAIDIAALALRISLWSITNPRTRPIFVFDEPFKNLSPNYHEAAGAVLREISSNPKTPIQIIMSTHDSQFINSADRIFYVKQNNGVSEVTDNRPKRTVKVTG